MGITRLNAYAGLAAGYVVRDNLLTGIDTGSGSATNLPAPPYELPLILQDKTFNSDGTLYYDPTPWVPEFFGDTAVVNGTFRSGRSAETAAC
jgi:FtsP/CotA-like multicopper oxidase with cupredoxin domain